MATARPIADRFSFGLTLHALRRRRNCHQSVIAAAASLSAGYYSDLENERRVAPPQKTTKRIALALRLATQETEQLLALAAADRAASFMKSNLSPRIRRLLIALLFTGPKLSNKTVDAIYAMLASTTDLSS